MFPTFVNELKIDQALDWIADAVQGGGADFLFGAGMSRTSEIPIGSELSRRLLELFFPEAHRPDPKRLNELVAQVPFEALVAAVEKTLPQYRTTLTEQLRAILLMDSAEPSQAHGDFASVCHLAGPRPNIRRIFTTNFDSLLSKAIGGSAVQITEANTREFTEATRDGRIPIVHLHGTLDSANYQITEKDVYSSAFRAVQAYFHAALLDSGAFTFVGYSMMDPDFRQIYMTFREDIDLRRREDKKTYVVSPAVDHAEYELMHAVWGTRGAEFIPLDAAGFFSLLKQRLKTRADTKVRNHIMRKYNLAGAADYDEKVKLTAELLHISPEEAVHFLAQTLTKMGKNK